MSTTTISSGSRQLPAIPLELCEIIAGYIDLPSAINLCRTCRTLRDIGEIKVYHRLDLTGTWNPTTDPIPNVAGLDTAGYQNRVAIVNAKLDAVLHALSQQPHRCEFVKEVRIEPSNSTPGLVTLLKLVSETIQRLDILPLPRQTWEADDMAALYSDDFFALFNKAEIPFPLLTHLKFASPCSPFSSLASPEAPFTTAVDDWMARMPSLEYLEYCSADGSFENPVLERVSLPPFQHLRCLTLGHLFDTGNADALSMLASLLTLAPNLEILSLRGQWRPRRHQPALQALAKLKKLKTLITMDEDYAGETVEIGIEYHKLGKVELSLEEAAVDLSSWVEHDEVFIENIPIPRAPLLQRLTVLSLPRPLAEDYAAVPIGSTPHLTMDIHPWFLPRMRRAPLLSTILFQYLPDYFPSPYRDHIELELFISPERWIDEGHRGILIRQYVDADSEAEFFHVRTLGRAAKTPNGVAYVAARRMWCDYTSYKGRTVPRHVLEKVYEEMDGRTDWLGGGRGLSMGQGAWGILDEWIEATGEGDYMGDEAFANGEEDNDLLSEAEA